MHGFLECWTLTDDLWKSGLVIWTKGVRGEPLNGIEPSVDGEGGEAAIFAVQDFLAGELTFE